MRMFVALLLPEAVVEHLSEYVAPRQQSGTDFRWTGPEQWHVTLAFMPVVKDRHLDDLMQRLARAARRRANLTVAVHGGGAFPDVSRARVLFAGIDAGEGSEELRRLSVGARAAANKAGAPAAGGRFHAHVTLARVRAPRDVTRWLRILDSYRGPPWQVGAIALVESHLGEGPRRRPRYEVLDTFPLSAP